MSIVRLRGVTFAEEYDFGESQPKQNIMDISNEKNIIKQKEVANFCQGNLSGMLVSMAKTSKYRKSWMVFKIHQIMQLPPLEISFPHVNTIQILKNLQKREILLIGTGNSLKHGQ